MTNKVTLNALSRKHAELQLNLALFQDELKKVQHHLNAVETTITLLEPDFNFKNIKPAVRYTPSKFERGEIPKLVGDFVRESTGNFSCPEIAGFIKDLKGIGVKGKELEKLNLRVYNALKRLEKNGIIVHVGKIKCTSSDLI